MSEIDDILKKPIQYIKGIGESRARLFRRLGTETVKDLISLYPRQYDDRSVITKVSEVMEGETVSIKAVVILPPVETRIRKGMLITKAKVRDDSGAALIKWFNSPFVKNTCKAGETYVFYGKANKSAGMAEMQNPAFEQWGGEMKKTCRIVPVYPSTAGLNQGSIRNAVLAVLEETEGQLSEIIPSYIRKQYGLAEINYAVKNIHFPKEDEAFFLARKRLVFEELLILQLGLFSIKKRLENNNGICFSADVDMEEIFEKLTFSLTKAQKKVYEEIMEDMESKRIMNRLIQGDVGSGKTVLAVLALFRAVKTGYQGAMMAPTEILAEQHYGSIKPLLHMFGINSVLLKGGMKASEKREVQEAVKTGTAQVVIGTHALLEDDVVFARLGLVITDEQHRFGVRQRNKLVEKGEKIPDVLVMTATPIPRTLALILYGDLDISVVDELPPGRSPVKTFGIKESSKDRAYGFIKEQIQAGRQIYIVCPLVEESEAISAKSAVQYYEQLTEQDFKGYRTGLLHGKMKAKDKDKVMKEFSEGKLDILVSTTVIEVGINVPNAAVMMIENSERFGLAQLHQLRGRVGRGKHQSYCILCYDGKSKVSLDRLHVMEQTNDGFVISEKDLELRGPGEFFGTRQHGIPDLKIADLSKDIHILKEVQKLSKELFRENATLSQPEMAEIKMQVIKRFGDNKVFS